MSSFAGIPKIKPKKGNYDPNTAVGLPSAPAPASSTPEPVGVTAQATTLNQGAQKAGTIARSQRTAAGAPPSAAPQTGSANTLGALQGVNTATPTSFNPYGGPMPTETTGLGAPTDPGTIKLSETLGDGTPDLGLSPDGTPAVAEDPALSTSIYDDVNNLWGGSLQNALDAANANTNRQQRQLAESTADLGAAAGGGNSTLAAAQGMAIGRSNEIDARMQHAMKGLEMKMAQFNAILGSEEAQKDRNLQEYIAEQRNETMYTMKLLDMGYTPEFDENGNIVGAAPPGGGPTGEINLGQGGDYVGSAPGSLEDAMHMSGDQFNAVFSGLPQDKQEGAQSTWQDVINNVSLQPGTGGLTVDQQKDMIRNIVLYKVANGAWTHEFGMGDDARITEVTNEFYRAIGVFPGGG